MVTIRRGFALFERINMSGTDVTKEYLSQWNTAYLMPIDANPKAPTFDRTFLKITRNHNLKNHHLSRMTSFNCKNRAMELETLCMCCRIVKEVRGDVCSTHHVHPEGISAANVNACNEIFIYGKIVSGMLHYLGRGSFQPGLSTIVKQYKMKVE